MRATAVSSAEETAKTRKQKAPKPTLDPRPEIPEPLVHHVTYWPPCVVVPKPFRSCSSPAVHGFAPACPETGGKRRGSRGEEGG